MTFIRVTRSDMGSECKSRLFRSIFLSQTSRSFRLVFDPHDPAFSLSLFSLVLSQNSLFRYAFNTLFPKHPFPWQSFRISFVSRATACLCVPPEFIRPTPSQMRHGNLVFPFFLFFVFLLFFASRTGQILFPSIPSKIYTSGYAGKFS